MKIQSRFEEFLRGHWIETAIALTTLVVVSAYGITEFPIVKDMGFFSYIGQEILRGYTPYSTVYEVKPPALFYFYALAMSTFGFLPQYMSIRVFMLILIAASVVMLYRIVLKSTNDKLLAALSCLIYISFVYSMELALLGDSKAVAIFFSFLTILLAYRRNYVLSGICASLSCLFWQPFGMLIFAPISMLVLEGNLKPLKLGGFVKVAIGFSIPIAVLVLYFAWLGTLPDLVNFSLLYALKYESSTVFERLLWKIARLMATFSTEFFFMTAAAVGALYVVYRALYETTKGRIVAAVSERKHLVAFVLPFVLLSSIFIKDFSGGSTFSVVLPVVSLLAAFVVETTGMKFKKILFTNMHLSDEFASKLAIALVVAAVCAYGFLPALQPVYPENPIISERDKFIGNPTPVGFLESISKEYGTVNFITMFLFRRPGEQVTIHHQLELAKLIQNSTSESDMLLSVYEPEILFLANRRNINKYPLYEGVGFYELSEERGELAGIVRDIIQYKPKFILYDDTRFLTKLGLDDFISSNYAQADFMAYHIYKLKTL